MYENKTPTQMKIPIPMSNSRITMTYYTDEGELVVVSMPARSLHSIIQFSMYYDELREELAQFRTVYRQPSRDACNVVIRVPPRVPVVQPQSHDYLPEDMHTYQFFYTM